MLSVVPAMGQSVFISEPASAVVIQGRTFQATCRVLGNYTIVWGITTPGAMEVFTDIPGALLSLTLQFGINTATMPARLFTSSSVNIPTTSGPINGTTVRCLAVKKENRINRETSDTQTLLVQGRVEAPRIINHMITQRFQMSFPENSSLVLFQGRTETDLQLDWVRPFSLNITDVDPDDWTRIEVNGDELGNWPGISSPERRNPNTTLTYPLQGESCDPQQVVLTSWNPVGAGLSQSVFFNMPPLNYCLPLKQEESGIYILDFSLLAFINLASLSLNITRGEQMEQADIMVNPENSTLSFESTLVSKQQPFQMSLEYSFNQTTNCQELLDETRCNEVTIPMTSQAGTTDISITQARTQTINSASARAKISEAVILTMVPVALFLAHRFQ